jgi:hypothetical protein
MFEKKYILSVYYSLFTKNTAGEDKEKSVLDVFKGLKKINKKLMLNGCNERIYEIF